MDSNTRTVFIGVLMLLFFIVLGSLAYHNRKNQIMADAIKAGIDPTDVLCTLDTPAHDVCKTRAMSKAVQSKQSDVSNSTSSASSSAK